MKKLILIIGIVLGVIAAVSAKQISINEAMPAFSLELLNSDDPKISLDELKGKVILLDFWATWCSPCITGMSHLDSLQKHFKDKLQVIAISTEETARLKRFIQKTNHAFLFARDNGALEEIVKYRVIPHAVLIDRSGKIAAITAPKHITHHTIEDVLNDQPVQLPEKVDIMDFDPTIDYFNADSGTSYSFDIQSYNSSFPTFSKTYHEGPFKNRRITIYNQNIEGLYRNAYQTSTYRVTLEFDEKLIDWKNKKNRYSMDIIVEQPEELYPMLQRKLDESLSIKAKTEMKKMKVVVLRKTQEGISAEKTTEPTRYNGKGDGFSSEGASMEDFREYLEDFGIFGLPVVDETNDNSLYKIDFSFDPENPESFKQAMKNLGLSYSWDERTIESLVLYKEEL